MNSNKFTLSNHNANSLYHLSETEEDDSHTFLDELIHNRFRNLCCYSFSFQPVSLRGTLNDIQNDTLLEYSTPKYEGYRSVVTNIKEKRSSKILFTKSIEEYLAHEPTKQIKPRIHVRCSSLKRLSAKEICTSFIFLQTLKETKKMVYFLNKS